MTECAECKDWAEWAELLVQNLLVRTSEIRWETARHEAVTIILDILADAGISLSPPVAETEQPRLF